MATKMIIRDALREGRALLHESGSEEAQLEAELLLMHATGLDRVRLYQQLEDFLAPAQWDAYGALLNRRLAHEPTPYITRRKEFFGLEFEVSPAALIPRPETETLVELVVAFVREKHPDAQVTLADVGVGSGTIAVSLAKELATSRVIATDTSRQALDLALRNAARHGVADRIDFREGDLLSPLDAAVQVIAANLPYVTTEMWEQMPPEIKDWEPRSALDGGTDGLDVIRRLFDEAPRWLADGGALFCEIGDWQGGTVREIALAAFPGARVEVTRDLAGRDRVVCVYR